MTKFRLLGTAFAVALVAFTVSCDKDALPEEFTSPSSATIGDGETSGFLVNGLVDGLISDFTINNGDDLINTTVDFTDNSDAFALETGNNKTIITATENGEEIEIFNEQMSFDDEKLYMFFVTQNEEGTAYQVDVMEYSTEDFEVSDSEMYEYGLTGNNEDYSTVNGYNYSYGFEEGQLVADFNYTTGGEFAQKDVAFGDYGSVTSFGLDKDGYYNDFDLNYLADEDSELLEGEYTQDLMTSYSLENLNYMFDSSSENQELTNMFIVGSDDNVEMFMVDLGSLNMNYGSFNVE